MNSNSRFLSILIPCLTTLSAQGQAISINFEGLDSNATSSNLLAPTDLAGLVPVTNWNNVSAASGTENDLNNESGVATTTSVTWNAQGIWSWEEAAKTVPASGDGTLFNGYLDTTGNDGSTTISVTGVPYTSYDVIVYIDGEHDGSERPMRINVNPGGSGDNPISDVFSSEGLNWNGSYVQALATTAPGTVGANYARFNGLTGSNFEIFAEAETFRATINGFQIVAAVDLDGDGLPGSWEADNGLDDNDNGTINPANGAAGDPDGDDSSNFEEFQRRTNPQDDDSDDDDLKDGAETGDGIFVDADATGTKPLVPDTDGDGLNDGAEVNGIVPTNPLLVDSDDDGLSDPRELSLGTNPRSSDTDNDNFDDSLEVALGSDPEDGSSTPNLNLASISINFEGLDDPNGGVDVPNALEPTEAAGLYSASGWNNVSGTIATVAALTDGNGNATSASIEFDSQALWSWEKTNTVVPDNPTGRMLNGYLDTTGNFGTHSITLKDIPFSVYDIIVYVDSEYSALEARPGSVSLNVTGQEFFFADNTNWDGTFTQAFGTDLATATPGANFVIFNDVTGSDITLLASARDFRVAVNGIQIIGDTTQTQNSFLITDINYDSENREVDLTWNSINNQNYQIQRSSTLMENDWTPVGTRTASSTSASFTVTSDQIPAESERLFFRVVFMN